MQVVLVVIGALGSVTKDADKMDGKAWNTRRCWSSAKDCLVRSGKDSYDGVRDVGATCPVSPWSFVMTHLTGEETAFINARAYAETSRIIQMFIQYITLQHKLLLSACVLINFRQKRNEKNRE